MRFAIDVAKAANAGALVDTIAAKAGLSATEREALAIKLAAMSGIADRRQPGARALFGIRRVQLLPGIGTVKAGRLCARYTAPEIRTVSANAYEGGAAIPGRAEGAAFDCGRAVMIDPNSGLMLAGPNNVLGGALIANDGASLVPVTKLLANDGASIISNKGGALQPVGGGTTFLPAGR